MSLAVVGLMAAIVQGGLARVIVPRLGEKRSVLTGFSLSALAFAFYGWAPQGWMLYPALIIGCTAGIAQPAGQALISWTVGPSEQGAVQGAITSLGSLAGIIGPLVATNLFGWFIGPKAPAHIPGIAFYLASATVLCALAVVARAFATIPVPARHAAAEILTAK
jgi:DHA1 family tetracycline resistance protein-like MFS transporter